MADWNVHIENDEVSVYDTSSHATLEEIRDLLKILVERTPICQHRNIGRMGLSAFQEVTTTCPDCGHSVTLKRAPLPAPTGLKP